jgi:PilZ domain-containing protein
VTFVTADRAISGHTRNVSHGGLCAMLDEELATGTAIELDLQLVFLDNRRSEPLRLPARIAWCTAIDDRFQIGVQFLALHEETSADLTMFLRYLERGELGSADSDRSAGDAGRKAPREIDGRGTARPPGAGDPLAVAVPLDDRFG